MTVNPKQNEASRPLHDPFESEVAEAVGEAFLPELHVLPTRRTREKHGRGGGVLSSPSRVRPARWWQEGRRCVEESQSSRNRGENKSRLEGIKVAAKLKGSTGRTSLQVPF